MAIFVFSVPAWLITVLVMASLATGLEFTLSRTKLNLPGVRSSSCGILLCEGTSSTSVGTVTNMTVFKVVTPPGMSSSSGANTRTPPRQLASVSSSQPNLQQVYDGMKIDGFLKDGQATLRVELSKQADCSEEYTCQLQEVDSHGKGLVTSYRLLQQHPDQSLDNAHLTSLTPSVLVRLFSLIQGLDGKLAVMEERLEDKLKSIESSWGDRAGDLKKELTDRVTFLQNSFQDKMNILELSFQGTLNTLEHSLQDRDSTKFQSIEEKLCQLDSKLSVIDSDAIQKKVLKTINTQIDVHFEKVMNASEITNDTLIRTGNLLATLRSNNTQFHNNIMESFRNVLDNVTRDMGELLTRNRNLTDTMKTNLIELKDDVELGWQRLESNTSNGVIKTVATLQGIASEVNATLVSNAKSALTEFFMPQSCKKNTPVPLHPASTPYPVIYRSEFTGLDTPLLCDTITDGGGWIVIQRRSTGAVNFYRDWLSYKEGFGTLDNDFWLGNGKIHAITSRGRYELRVDLKYKGESKFALYDRFSLSGEDKNYAITIGSYSGTAGDSLTQHNGRGFSTYDRDNDTHSRMNCASSFKGAWWYRACHASNLNGKWQAGDRKGVVWGSFTGSNSASFSEMKIRYLDF